MGANDLGHIEVHEQMFRSGGQSDSKTQCFAPKQAVNHRMNFQVFRVLFLYKWKNNHNAATAARNIDAEFGDYLVNEHSIRYWYAKFESGDKSLTKEYRGRLETVVHNEVLRTTVLLDCAEELGRIHTKAVSVER
ncbi:hypothetical protein TNCV_2331081 [Trichonephila clavipes]|nr:hypothetical protein TNCV_2331081 [Trichonephila clavipes]